MEALGGHFKATGGHLTQGTHRISDTAFHLMIPTLLINSLAAICFYYMGAFHAIRGHKHLALG